MAFTTSRGRTQTALAEINITPLVDVVLVLLIIFMITAPVLQSGIQVDVPQTRTVKQIVEQHVVVTIDKDQNVYLQQNGPDEQINVNALTGRLRALPGDAAHKTIYVRADTRVTFGAFANVMDAVKQAGIVHISIVTQPIER